MLDNLKLGKPKKLAQYKPRENGGTLNELRRRQYRANYELISAQMLTLMYLYDKMNI